MRLFEKHSEVYGWRRIEFKNIERGDIIRFVETDNELYISDGMVNYSRTFLAIDEPQQSQDGKLMIECIPVILNNCFIQEG